MPEAGFWMLTVRSGIWYLVSGISSQPLGQTEVGDPDLIVEIDQDVGRFEVAVQDAVLVGIMHGLGDAADVSGGLARRQRTAADEAGQILAFDIIHREERLALDVADFVDGDDVGVPQAGGGLGLAMEAFNSLPAGERAQQEHLHGDDPVQADLAGAVNNPHPAVGDLFQQFIVAEGAQPGLTDGNE